MQLLPPVQYVAPTSPIDPTNQPGVFANLTAVAQGDAFDMNVRQKNTYIEHTFKDWDATYQAGRDPDYLAGKAVSPPSPPNGFMVQVDETWKTSPVYPQIGPPVCDIPVYTRIPPPQGTAPVGHIHIQKKIPGSQYWSAGQDDTAPAGTVTTTTTADDGATGTFQKVGFFMGPGWWLKTA